MTAEELYNDMYFNYKGEENTVLESMKRFAQYHVEQALKAASEQLTDVGAELSRCYDQVEKSILNAYPKDNIK